MKLPKLLLLALLSFGFLAASPVPFPENKLTIIGRNPPDLLLFKRAGTALGHGHSPPRPAVAESSNSEITMSHEPHRSQPGPATPELDRSMSSKPTLTKSFSIRHIFGKSRTTRPQTALSRGHDPANSELAKSQSTKPGYARSKSRKLDVTKPNINWSEDEQTAYIRKNPQMYLPPGHTHWDPHVCDALGKLRCESANAEIVRSPDDKRDSPYTRVTGMNPAYRTSTEVHIFPGDPENGINPHVVRLPPPPTVSNRMQQAWWRVRNWGVEDPKVKWKAPYKTREPLEGSGSGSTH